MWKEDTPNLAFLLLLDDLVVRLVALGKALSRDLEEDLRVLRPPEPHRGVNPVQ